jgi:PAS domain-containing protein
LEQLRRLPVDVPADLPAAVTRPEIHLPLVSEIGKLQRTVPPRMPEPGLLESMTLADGGLLLKVLDLLEDGAYVVDTDRRILYWNPAAARIAGFSNEEMVGSMCWDHGMCHVDDEGTERCHDRCPLTLAFDGTDDNVDASTCCTATGTGCR